MLKADVETYRNGLASKSRTELTEIAVDNFIQRTDLENRLHDNEMVLHEMFLQFDSLKKSLSEAEIELSELRKQNLRLTGIYSNRTQELFGRSSEKTSFIVGDVCEIEDPLDEDACTFKDDQKDSDHKPKGKVINFRGPRKSVSGKKRSAILSDLPKTEYYDYDLKNLNNLYGEGNWRFCYWERHETVEVQRQCTYCKVTYTPVVSCGLDHTLERPAYEGKIIPKSFASSSLLALIFNDYGNMHLPFYRMEHDPDRYGISISRQTMTNWMIYVSQKLFRPVKEHLENLLRVSPYQQCDETKYLAINEKEHSTNYIWAHRTSSLSDTEQIIIYCFEPSRAAGHLFRFYSGIKEHIYLTSDAYGAYHSLESEYPELITICGCFMHARRRLVDSLRISQKGLSTKESENLPEMKCIEIIGRLYSLESGLSELTDDRRLEERKVSVKPVVDEYFEYIRTIDLDDPLYSDTFKDAVKYSLNQEKQLRRFLEDGNIPIDDGATERNIKNVALHRKNSLFSFSVKGAESSMTLMSLIETAKANKAVPYYYLKYLMEEMSKGIIYGHQYNINDMMPWSESYKKYEITQKSESVASGAPPGNTKPRTPTKEKRNKMKNIA
ncbi:MAG: IS66 family transposase [Lachnospiraceae bacterium]|nr:IS66 family transposase [Lachnospiraceae bacterium]